MPVPHNQGGTGKMPVANNLERARCPFHKIQVEQASCLLPTISNGQDARSTIKQFLVEQAEKPVPKWHNIYPDE
ncbi:hypothetical protein [Microcoleus vaginatus]|uniref:hypothetical protein n=1 Tax=Microcoleus vaginatus TaxID=119532 RepID=UPI001686C9E1|nr:hypothetical protein [Microcoleus sp. FACHB-84]MBD2009405.1 hypothetical protein [Microcoleus sp. FACHB-45]